MASIHIFKYFDMHTHRSTHHLELFSPEKIKAWMSLHNIQRTFKAENKGFWRETARANVERIRFYTEQLSTLYGYIHDQECPAQPHQIKLKNKYLEEFNLHVAALKISLGRRHSSFAMHKTDNEEAKSLIYFFNRLRMLNKQQENTAFLGNIIEEALGIYQEKVFHEEPHEADLGLNNEPLLKRIIASINCDSFTGAFNSILSVQVVAEQVSERLTQLGKRSTYKIPTYSIR